MIHRGLRDMMIERVGPEGWAELEQHLQVGPAEFISLNLYDDELTIRMIASAAAKLEIGTATMMRDFGRSWVQFAERGSFGSMLSFTGRTLGEFIGNLDRLHQAVIVAMPQARVPSFVLVEDHGQRMVVDYRSDRAGLEPFVVGLFEGLLDRFGLRGSVLEIGEVPGGARFEITIEGP
ncbi:MAG: heme NO-binding domain-containing protein [Proteobacteria bacterium]|nr:heme NO-binding domain-containing protein [Pseudomonadota bacterium]